MPEVTVIVPVFNGEPYIRKCMNSLVHQTMKELEVLVINDGSTDHTLEILREYEQKYSFVRVINQENRGLFRTRQRGLEEARGDYIGWVDADDFVDINMFQKLYELAKSHHSDFVYCDYDFYPNKIATKQKWFRLYRGEKDVDFVEQNSQPWNKLVKKSLLQSLNIGKMFPSCFDEAYIKVLINASNPIALSEKLYYYRVGNGTMSSSYSDVKHYEKFVEASISLKREMLGENKYWTAYFDYRVNYYMLMTMLVAAYAREHTIYRKYRRLLLQNSYLKNMHMHHILTRNFGKLKAFAIMYLLPSNYVVAMLLGHFALK